MSMPGFTGEVTLCTLVRPYTTKRFSASQVVSEVIPQLKVDCAALELDCLMGCSIRNPFASFCGLGCKIARAGCEVFNQVSGIFTV